jgi:hypothetical protein
MSLMSKQRRQAEAPGGARSDTPVTQARAAFSRHGLRVTLVRMTIIGGFLLLWQIASGPWVEPFLISSPSRILASLVTGFRDGDLLHHTWVTFQEIAIGFPIGALAGIILGYAFGRSRWLAEIFEPIIVALNGIPRTAVAPLFIVWLGIGLWSKVGIVVLLTFFLNFFMTYTVLIVRPDYLEANPTIATAVARAISRGGALFHTHPDAAKAALHSHRLYTQDKLAEEVFELSYAMVASAMPAWGTMSVEGWQKVLNFAAGAGMLKEPAKAPSAQEGVLWTNKYVGQAP